MHTALGHHIKKFITINEEELQGVLPYFRYLQFKKKQDLLVEGKVCKDNYFTVKGCCVCFYKRKRH
jgi:hypothetical protein